MFYRIVHKKQGNVQKFKVGISSNQYDIVDRQLTTWWISDFVSSETAKCQRNYQRVHAALTILKWRWNLSLATLKHSSIDLPIAYRLLGIDVSDKYSMKVTRFCHIWKISSSPTVCHLNMGKEFPRPLANELDIFRRMTLQYRRLYTKKSCFILFFEVYRPLEWILSLKTRQNTRPRIRGWHKSSYLKCCLCQICRIRFPWFLPHSTNSY